MRGTLIGMGMTLVLASGAASAADRSGANAIIAGDYVTAERTIVAERRIFPRRPELMLNLAAVYRQTGRDAQASQLYTDVLRSEPVMVDRIDQRTVSSHSIASSALTQLTQMAAR